MQNDTRIAVDVAKAVFEIAVSDRPGRVTRRERLPRAQFLTFFAQHPAATVVMEACGSAHYWGRRIEQLGHRVVLLPPHHVRPYVRRNKTDRTDAKGILEASRNEDIRPVPVKTVAQQVADLAAPASAPAGCTSAPPASTPCAACCASWASSSRSARARWCPRCGLCSRTPTPSCPTRCGPLFAEACHEIRDIEARIKHVERQLEAMAEQLPVVEHLLTIPGIGLLTATALFAFIGDIHRFPSGRHLASYLGLTPREYSSGLKRHLGRISKRGDGYLRTLLIHGARSIAAPRTNATAGSACASGPTSSRKTHVHNKAAVAVANKMARIVWAVWSRLQPYGQDHRAA